MRFGVFIIIACVCLLHQGDAQVLGKFDPNKTSDISDKKFDSFDNKTSTSFDKKFEGTKATDTFNKEFSAKSTDFGDKKFNSKTTSQFDAQNSLINKRFNTSNNPSYASDKRFNAPQSLSDRDKRFSGENKYVLENGKIYAGDLPAPLQKMTGKIRAHGEEIADDGVLTEDQVKERLNKVK